MSERGQQSAIAAVVGLAAGLAMAGVNSSMGHRDPRTALFLAVIAGMAFVIVLKFVLGRSWRETSIVTALAVVGTWVIENVITQGADQYSMAYKQTDLMLMRLALPLLILVGGCFIFKSLRTWQAWAIILGTSAAANVASSVLYNWGGFGSSGYFPFGATVLLPIAALIAALGYVLSGEPV